MNAGDGSSNGIRSEINITPLVDVVLVLLIIFMVVTPLVQMGHSVQVPPTSKGPSPAPEAQLILRLDRSGTIFLNALEVPRAQLAAKLAEGMTGRASRVVFFAAHGELEYGEVADFLDFCHASGAPNLGIVFEELEGPPRLPGVA